MEWRAALGLGIVVLAACTRPSTSPFAERNAAQKGASAPAESSTPPSPKASATPPGPFTAKPRAVVLVPRYLWTEAGPDIATVVNALSQSGMPFDKQAPGTDWDESLASLDRYSLAIIPGYLMGSAVRTETREKLEEFAKKGGILVFFKPVGTPEHKEAWTLGGLRGSLRRRDVIQVRFDGPLTPTIAALDSPEERSLRINQKITKDAVEVYTLDPDPAVHTQVVAHAFGVDQHVLGATVTRRPFGKGAIYTMGHDLATFDSYRCYVNCFEPSGDVMRLFFEGALREGTQGHIVTKHTVPGVESSVLLVTHDLDAPDAFNRGEWGEAGAVRVAAIERQRGIRSTFNITTDYIAGYFNRETLRALCPKGECGFGAHGVMHPDSFTKMAKGSCVEKATTYRGPATLCGEVRVSLEVQKDVLGRAPRVWRSPYLAQHPALYEVLAQNSIAFDSGFGIGDMPYNLPIALADFGHHQNRFHHQPLIEFPVACEDGTDTVEAGRHTRLELQTKNADTFLWSWEYVTKENIKNRAYTTLLLHPSRGFNMPIENLGVKIGVLEKYFDRIKDLDLVTRTMEEAGDFWRARSEATLDATFDSTRGYTGTLVVGNTTAPGLSLEFGDDIAQFSCETCGEVKIRGKRVTIVKALPPGTKVEFASTLKQ